MKQRMVAISVKLFWNDEVFCPGACTCDNFSKIAILKIAKYNHDGIYFCIKEMHGFKSKFSFMKIQSYFLWLHHLKLECI